MSIKVDKKIILFAALGLMVLSSMCLDMVEYRIETVQYPLKIDIREYNEQSNRVSTIGGIFRDGMPMSDPLLNFQTSNSTETTITEYAMYEDDKGRHIYGTLPNYGVIIIPATNETDSIIEKYDINLYNKILGYTYKTSPANITIYGPYYEIIGQSIITQYELNSSNYALAEPAYTHIRLMPTGQGESYVGSQSYGTLISCDINDRNIPIELEFTGGPRGEIVDCPFHTRDIESADVCYKMDRFDHYVYIDQSIRFYSKNTDNLKITCNINSPAWFFNPDGSADYGIYYYYDWRRMVGQENKWTIEVVK